MGIVNVRCLAWLFVGATPLGCGGMLGAGHPLSAPPPVDTAGEKLCKIAALHERPLVTEWAASEKADLEGRVSSGQVVAVRYSGCELQIIDGCKLQGRYAFRRTTLSTDTVEIHDEDDLYAKLPLGAVGLEGELARSGRLAVRTTVAGEFRLDATPAGPLDQGACREATHVVTAVSVGAFSLLAGGAVSASAGLDARVGKAGLSGKREETTVRQAGDDRACRDATEASPSPMCASPLQVFLSRLRAEPVDDAGVEREAAERRARAPGRSSTSPPRPTPWTAGRCATPRGGRSATPPARGGSRPAAATTSSGRRAQDCVGWTWPSVWA